MEKPVITGECFVHQFKWKIVESGEYEFQARIWNWSRLLMNT